MHRFVGYSYAIIKVSDLAGEASQQQLWCIVNQRAFQNCPACAQVAPAKSRFCPYCGASLPSSKGEKGNEDDTFIPASKNLRVSPDTLDIQELLTIVESGFAQWKHSLNETEGAAREQAAAAVKHLSQVMDSLSQQLAQGRKTVRITTRLPTLRSYSVGCPACGHGNRAGAQFCQNCGTLLLKTGSQKEKTQASYHLRVASRSDMGQVRTNNEDAILTQTIPSADGRTATLLMVADGMGGAQAGEEASRIAIETVQQSMQQFLQKGHPQSADDWQAWLQKTIQTANTRIYTQAQEHPEQRGMGTTGTIVIVAEQIGYLCHVGDSRAYIINPDGVTDDGAKLMQLTTDHTLVARLVDIGQISLEEAKKLPQRNMLYRALGVEATVEGDTSHHPLEFGDILLLCSDGLTNYVHEHELAQLVLQAANLESACTELVTLANDRGGRDNISVVIARVESR